MPSYAVLGSTGSCGSALLLNLLKSPNNKINAYCRNYAKLQRVVPAAANSKQVQVFEGSINDVDLIVRCIRGTKAVFLAVATNDNVPGCNLNQTCAAVVIQALQRLRAESGPGVVLPKLVVLSAAPINDHISRHMNPWLRRLLLTALSNVYEDARRTEEYLREHEDWVTSIFVNAAGLSVDVARGHRLTLDEEESFVSYLDLAAGMIEAADDEEGKYGGKNVSVVNETPGVGARVPRNVLGGILFGLLRHFFPWMHPYLPSMG